MTHLDHEAVAVVRAAQLTVINAKWRICEEQAVARLAGVRGLACTPLFPGHRVIQVVACDARLLGRVRLHHDGRTARWIAVPAGAARALARHAEVHRLRVTDCPVLASAAPAPFPWLK